jgi:hypothetical protein
MTIKKDILDVFKINMMHVFIYIIFVIVPVYTV